MGVSKCELFDQVNRGYLWNFGNFYISFFFFFSKVQKVISVIDEAIVLILSVNLPMVNIYKFCKKIWSDHLENLENNI